ncbi:TPA: DUF551 domain-containing protein [Escherichia coli]
MAELTKEWLKQTIAEYEANRDELPFGLDTNSAIELQAFKLALASLEAEPVAYIFKHPAGKLFWALTDESNKDQSDVIPVYAASPAPIASEAIENAIEYIRSIAFHIDEDDYHGKHIAYFMRQALAWLEGHSCSDDRLGKAENQPVRGNQAAESNRGNEWTCNPDIDNAIIMLDRIDTLESCDDDRIEAVKTVLRRLAGNSPIIPDGLSTVCAEAYQVVGVMADALGVFGDAAVQKVLDNLSQQKLVHRDVLPFSLPVTPDGWVMVPKQVTPEISNAINVVGQRCTCGNCSQRLWDLLLDATQQGVDATQQGVNRG